MAKIIIGCRLPHGLTLTNPLKPSETVTLNGANKAVVLGSDCGTTEVDADFWSVWKTAHKDFPALRSGALFEAKSAEGATAAARERKKEKTGFEAMPPESMGVKPSDKE